MSRVVRELKKLSNKIGKTEARGPIPFVDFLEEAVKNFSPVTRSVFQVFHDMVKTYIREGQDEYPDDPESIGYIPYDCRALFVEGSDRPFRADRLFANKLIRLVDSWKRSSQQNKIYIFDGPPGCGKSTFLNNLLRKFEEYCNTIKGSRYEAVWLLDKAALGVVDTAFGGGKKRIISPKRAAAGLQNTSGYVEVPCPSHDNPIMVIPKKFRRDLLDSLLPEGEFKDKLFHTQEYKWVFEDRCCTVCESLYEALFNKLGSLEAVLGMLFARRYRFNRRLSQGISIFNPGDRPSKQMIKSNEAIQKQLTELFGDSNLVRYIFSRYATINNGIYALMDIKSHNVERIKELHNIISEGVHKIGDIEESVNSLLLAVMNPEDKRNIKEIKSFSDRIEYIRIPYVLDYNTEVEVYRDIFGVKIDKSFLPGVLENFARVIISTRLDPELEAMDEWIEKPSRYRKYCDGNLLLVKMEFYVGIIPRWLSEKDKQKLTAARRRKILAESELEGDRGFSGRDAIKYFNDFYSTYFTKENGQKLINMSMLVSYFAKLDKRLKEEQTKIEEERGEELALKERVDIPDGFLGALLKMYNYTIEEQMKESLYEYNEKQISRDIINYLFALNCDFGSVVRCKYTGDKFTVSEDFLHSIEIRLRRGKKSDASAFRKKIQQIYVSKTLTQEIQIEGKRIEETELYGDLYQRYCNNLKDSVLDPFIDNENFRRAIMEYGQEEFSAYDERVKKAVINLFKNLVDKFGYSEKGAQEVCVYAIDIFKK